MIKEKVFYCGLCHRKIVNSTNTSINIGLGWQMNRMARKGGFIEETEFERLSLKINVNLVKSL